MFPDLSNDRFKIADREFSIRVLPYKFEQMFRRSAMPIIEAELKPIERAVVFFTSDEKLITPDAKLTESFAQSELNADIWLTNCLIVMCISQDERWLKAGAEGKELTRDEQLKIESEYRSMIEYGTWPEEVTSPRAYMRAVVRKQQDKLKMVQRLGESLMARCEDMASLTGTKGQFDLLKQGFTQRVSKFLGKAGSLVGASANSPSPSTAVGSETPKPDASPKTPQPERNKDEAETDPEAGPAEPLVQ